MNKQISLNDFKEDVSTYVDFVIDNGFEVIVNENEESGIAIVPLDEYKALQKLVSEQKVN
ncbi:MAG: type II toxin-antitoxin system Phd/YefM family antitoxin [Flavobacteriaceae bacterium]|jgi:prevent-host-death family protein|nr:type II toxin-antitoxin system Phd/YefM family antitoxin [Flavobacteriaceae bacterium]